VGDTQASLAERAVDRAAACRHPPRTGHPGHRTRSLGRGRASWTAPAGRTPSKRPVRPGCVLAEHGSTPRTRWNRLSRAFCSLASTGPPPRWRGTHKRQAQHTRKRPKELVGGPLVGSHRLRNESGVVTLRPGPSLAGLAAVEPGSRDRPEDRSPVRSGGSHLPLRARRTLPAGTTAPQRSYPRSCGKSIGAYPRLCSRCGRHVDGMRRNADATSIDGRGT
jgi:hypothetical protein